MTRLGATSSDTAMTIGNPHLEKHIVKVVRSCRFLVIGGYSRRFSLKPTPDQAKETRFQKKQQANSSNYDIRRLFVKPRSKLAAKDRPQRSTYAEVKVRDSSAPDKMDVQAHTVSFSSRRRRRMAFGVTSDCYRPMIDQLGCKVTVSLRWDDDRQDSSTDEPGALLQKRTPNVGQHSF